MIQMDPNEERLVIRAKEGDARAFDSLVQRFQKAVFYTILKIVRDRHLADDLTQEVFIKVFKGMVKLEKPASFPSWLLRMASNRAIDSLRKQKRRRERVFLVEDLSRIQDEEGSRASLSHGLGEAETRERARTLERKLAQAIDELPLKQRKVLLLALDGKMKQEEIAEVLRLPKGTVKSRLHHARKFLAAKLRFELKGEG